MRILVLPDLHAPYHHAGAIAFLRALKKEYKTTAVVCIGDLGDQHGWSRHERQPDAPGQGDEDRLTLAFCRELYAAFPVALACVGNHDERLAKRCVRAGVPARLHRSVSEVYESPKGWAWDNRHTLDGVAFTHGDGFSGRDAAIKAAISNRRSTVIGHVHSAAGVMYSTSPYSTVWGMSVGCLVDDAALAFAYARKGVARPVFGAGVVLDGVPIFVPMR